jgi:hypothetical protein
MKEQIFDLLSKYLDDANEVEKFYFLNVYRSIEFYYWKHYLNREELDKYDDMTKQFVDFAVLTDKLYEQTSLPSNSEYYRQPTSVLIQNDKYDFKKDFVPK